MAHYYTMDGEPLHYMNKVKGGGTRPTNLADARKLRLAPSVTEVLKLLDKPALNNWRVDQALLSALTLPRKKGETLDEFKRRAAVDSQKQVKEAADRGTYLHKQVERMFLREIDGEIEPIAEQVYKYIINLTGIDSGWRVEHTFTERGYGFGGTIDLWHPEAEILIDHKSKDITDVDKRMAYDEHAMQLFAYSRGIQQPAARKINLFFDRQTPGLITHHEWVQDDVYWERFKCILKYWQLTTGHNPAVTTH